MNTYYIDFWLKNEVVIETYIDTSLGELEILERLKSNRSPFIEANLRENTHLIAINKEEIACIEIVAKEINNA